MNKMKTYGIPLTGGQISDLFFNYEHPEYDKLTAEATEDESRAAIVADAKAFCEFYIPTDFADEINAETLADDFLERL